MSDHREVIRFWFEEIEPRQRWRPSEAFDRQLGQRFSKLHQAATRCELYSWRQQPQGRLAEIIILDQFSRHLFRHRAEAYAQDPLALVLAQEAVATGCDLELPPEQRSFIYMPYMHSESALIHREALALFSQPGLERSLEFEKRHKRIIDRFGRYPHRNQIIGRDSTAEELAFLRQPGSSF